MIPQEIIRKKRDKKTLSKKEISLFVNGLTDGSFSDPQVAAMSMAIFLNGMSREETVDLTEAMTTSGDIISWADIVDDDLVCDKHSTGGVGDKTSIILAPILAACGLFVPMISGRGLGHTGGTLDKFDSIKGYNTQPDLDTFKNVVKDVGCAIIGQTENLAPADKKLYSIRDIVGTVESLPLITSSILSKKIASGLKTLVLDVKVGNGSFNSSLEIARDLSHSLVQVAQGAGLQCEAILTDMNQVLGKSAGHTLEMLECIRFLLNKEKDIRLEKITYELTSSILMMSQNLSKDEAIKKINTVVSSGLAAEKFEKMVHALGGPVDILSSYKKYLEVSSFKKEIFSKRAGWIKNIKTRELGLILIELGGGRKQITDKINYNVGYNNVLNVGDKIDSSQSILTVYTDSINDYENVREKIEDCFIISDSHINALPETFEVIK
ncbi:MAG: thymidine phosphorylase [Pelagibacteraceae bacterium]|nr:thymidine phosphorylase [Pelagibacteraceae bacterium]MBT4645360.1 thymidine phosphorylase [Pelagibacteraceae bacterium]MBT5214623.1 thymidine phosphorylase [Pelagibacteraceae bacterium]MBT6355106.1 thymidine phosphorylase [Pelagibacteraceae bacterium]